MPYSKNPLKYPHTFELFLKGLEGRKDVSVVQTVADSADATRYRVQMQAYLAAVVRYAEELDEKWNGMMRGVARVDEGEKRARMDGYRRDLAKWQALAQTAAGLSVRSFQEGGEWKVEIKTRSAGAFEEGLLAAVGGQAAVEVKIAGGQVEGRILELQNIGTDWIESGVASAPWLSGAIWRPGEDAANVKELANAMIDPLGDPVMATRQADVAMSLLILRRMGGKR